MVYYGLSRDNLDQQVRVSVQALEKVEDPQRGAVYRYVLDGVSPDKSVYVALSAFSGDNTSPMSDVREVTP